jgi:hydrogenase nickel incorporation protein HypA/HybF
MHELSLASAVVNTVVKHADGRAVNVVRLRVGGMRQVVTGSLEFYFEFVARDSVCEGARLELEHVATRLRCEDCSAEWEPVIPAFRCPDCAGGGVSVIAGEEFEVDWIEIEQPKEPEEAECIARG